MRVAIIDMGTNTFHLLVAEIFNRDFKVLLDDRVSVRIGAGGINQNIIKPEAIERTLTTLTNFKKKIIEFDVTETLAFGTSAFRNAKNGIGVALKIKEVTGIETKIISGDDEANFIYQGVNLALNLGAEKTLVMDIGGGSVEFIIGDGEKIVWEQSFEIGAQRLLERFQKHDPILKSEIDEVINHVESELWPLFDAMKIYSPKIVAGSSGTFDTLSQIYCNRYNLPKSSSPETPLTIEGFYEIYPEIISKNRQQRMQMPGMIELRVDMIVVACCLVKFMIGNFQFEKIRVSSYSLKEGVLALLLKNGLTENKIEK